MIYRIAVGNTDPETLASFLSDAGFDGTAFAGIGFTEQWGTEPSAVAILARPEDDSGWIVRLCSAVRDLLRAQDESAAYMDNGEDAWLLWQDGDWTDLN